MSQCSATVRHCSCYTRCSATPSYDIDMANLRCYTPLPPKRTEAAATVPFLRPFQGCSATVVWHCENTRPKMLHKCSATAVARHPWCSVEPLSTCVCINSPWTGSLPFWFSWATVSRLEIYGVQWAPYARTCLNYCKRNSRNHFRKCTTLALLQACSGRIHLRLCITFTRPPTPPKPVSGIVAL